MIVKTELDANSEEITPVLVSLLAANKNVRFITFSIKSINNALKIVNQTNFQHIYLSLLFILR